MLLKPTLKVFTHDLVLSNGIFREESFTILFRACDPECVSKYVEIRKKRPKSRRGMLLDVLSLTNGFCAFCGPDV